MPSQYSARTTQLRFYFLKRGQGIQHATSDDIIRGELYSDKILEKCFNAENGEKVLLQAKSYDADLGETIPALYAVKVSKERFLAYGRINFLKSEITKEKQKLDARLEELEKHQQELVKNDVMPPNDVYDGSDWYENIRHKRI